jgi:hypothetical protein
VLARVKPFGEGRVLALPGTLTPAALPILLDADFPERLRAALQPEPAAPTRAMAESMSPSHVTTAAAGAHSLQGAHPLDAWLVVLVAILFLVERFVATRPRAEASA